MSIFRLVATSPRHSLFLILWFKIVYAYVGTIMIIITGSQYSYIFHYYWTILLPNDQYYLEIQTSFAHSVLFELYPFLQIHMHMVTHAKNGRFKSGNDF